MAKKNGAEKVKSDNGFEGVSSQGAAIYAPGKHPRDRQLADKRAAESAAAPVVPAEEAKPEEGHEEMATVEATGEAQAPEVKPEE